MMTCFVLLKMFACFLVINSLSISIRHDKDTLKLFRVSLLADISETLSALAGLCVGVLNLHDDIHLRRFSFNRNTVLSLRCVYIFAYKFQIISFS